MTVQTRERVKDSPDGVVTASLGSFQGQMEAIPIGRPHHQIWTRPRFVSLSLSNAATVGRHSTQRA
jgi:hypothetical protein